jgi:hypothetical protein
MMIMVMTTNKWTLMKNHWMEEIIMIRKLLVDKQIEEGHSKNLYWIMKEAEISQVHIEYLEEIWMKLRDKILKSTFLKKNSQVHQLPNTS